MKRRTSLLGLIALFFGGPRWAHAERSWSGRIHLVDANLIIDFDGYEYGDWDDVARLAFPGRPAPYSTAKFVGFRIAADGDNPFRATLKGKVHVKVDRKTAELRGLVLVRDNKYANWRVAPDIIERLKCADRDESRLHSDTDK